MASIVAMIESTLAVIGEFGIVVGDVIADVEGAYADFVDTLTLTETIGLYIAEIAFIIGIIDAIAEIFTNLRVGINNHVKCGATEFDYGADNFAFTFKVMWDCFWDKFVSFWNGECTVYYLIDIIFGIVYGIVIELPIILIRAIFGINLQPIVNDIYEMVILPLNDVVYLMTGFYIVKWNEHVTNKCFRCKGIYHTSKGKNVVLHKTFNQWAELNKCNMSQMKNGFVKIFESLIPSDKWTKWLNNDKTPSGQLSTDGSTNWPAFF